MSKKDYIKIADCFKRYLNDYPDRNCNALLYEFCLMFALNNPNFNQNKFLDYIEKGTKQIIINK